MKVHRLSILSHAAPEAEVVWDNKGADRISHNKVWLRSFRNVFARVTLVRILFGLELKLFRNHATQILDSVHYMDVGIILGMDSDSKRRRYHVASSFLGWGHAQNDPWGDLISSYFPFNTLRQRQSVRHFTDDISNAFSSKLNHEISLKFVLCLFPDIHMTSKHWSG